MELLISLVVLFGIILVSYLSDNWGKDYGTNKDNIYRKLTPKQKKEHNLEFMALFVGFLIVIGIAAMLAFPSVGGWILIGAFVLWLIKS